MQGLCPDVGALFFLLDGSGCVGSMEGRAQGLQTAPCCKMPCSLDQMAQWAKVLAAKTTGPSSVPIWDKGTPYQWLLPPTVSAVLVKIILHLHIHVKGDRISEVLG